MRYDINKVEDTIKERTVLIFADYLEDLKVEKAYSWANRGRLICADVDDRTPEQRKWRCNEYGLVEKRAQRYKPLRKVPENC